jgi:hypothetical protein
METLCYGDVLSRRSFVRRSFVRAHFEATAPGKNLCGTGNFPFKLQFCEASLEKSYIILVESELQHDVVLADRIDFKDFNKYC